MPSELEFMGKITTGQAAELQKNGGIAALLRGLANTVSALHHLAPGVVAIGILLLIAIGWACLYSKPLMISMVLAVVGISSLFVYFGTASYGQGALALVGGLLTAYSVQWNPPNFIAFLGLWGGFSFLAIIVESVKVAMKTEEIYRRAAVLLAPEDHIAMESALRKIGRHNPDGYLGPIERAETILHFSFRRVPFPTMPKLLDLVGKISTVTGLTPRETAKFIADLFKALENEDPMHLLAIWDFFREVPVPPEEVVTGFHATKSILLSGRLSAAAYLERLRIGFQRGIPADRMEAFILEHQ